MMEEKEKCDSDGSRCGTVFTFYKDIQNELDNHFTKALSLPAPDTTASHSSTSLISSKLSVTPYSSIVTTQLIIIRDIILVRVK